MPCFDFYLTARSTGLEPATSRVHIVPYFHKGVDYIFTINLATFRYPCI